MFKKMLFMCCFLSITSVSNIVQSEQFSAINISQCKDAVGRTKPFILVLKKGEKLNQAIIQCMKDAKISSASLSGLGGIMDPKLGYYNLNKHQYEWKKVKGEFELLSLNGNVTKDEKGDYKTHIHVLLGKDNYETMGGHLDSGTVSITAEITVIPFTNSVKRKFDLDIQLPLIDPSA